MCPCSTAHSTKLFAGSEVHHVVLVDPRWDEQQRRLEHGLRSRLVLDQLDQAVSEHDLARRNREVLAEGQRARVDLPGPATVVDEVVEKPREAAGEARAARLEGLLQRCRVAQEEVRWGESVDQLADGELGLARGLAVVAGTLSEFPHRLRPQQVALTQAVEACVRLPGRVGEARVPGVKLGRALNRGAKRARHDDRAHLGEAHCEPRSRGGDQHRLRRQPLAEIGERCTERRRIDGGAQAPVGLRALIVVYTLALRSHRYHETVAPRGFP